MRTSGLMCLTTVPTLVIIWDKIEAHYVLISCLLKTWFLNRSLRPHQKVSGILLNKPIRHQHIKILIIQQVHQMLFERSYLTLLTYSFTMAKYIIGAHITLESVPLLWLPWKRPNKGREHHLIREPCVHRALESGAVCSVLSDKRGVWRP